MFQSVLFAGLVLALPLCAAADEATCPRKGCPTPYRLTSTSEERVYAILIAAPDSGCGKVRFRVEGEDATFLGHTPPLAPGQLAVVRVGRGYSRGEHELVIAAEGCQTQPAATRRVTLAKGSPDHGWRGD